MDKDQVEGKLKDLKGRVQRQAGEWTDRKEDEVEGAGTQAEGKVQKAWGDLKEKGRDVADDLKSKVSRSDEEREEERKRA